jgi:hypothetical protein
VVQLVLLLLTVTTADAAGASECFAERLTTSI